MKIERTSEEIIIRLSPNIDLVKLQKLIDSLKIKEFTSKSKATQEQIDKLALDVNKSWWAKNKSSLLG